MSCVQGLQRWLEDGVLPVLNARHVDDDVTYDTKMFVTNGCQPLTRENVIGTHYLVEDHYSYASMLTEEQEKRKDLLLEKEMQKKEEPVIYIKIEARNNAEVPRYCWMRIPVPFVESANELSEYKSGLYESSKGYGFIKKDMVYLIASLNGKPVPQQEMAILLKPGETAEYIFKIPHHPISEVRADALVKQDFKHRLRECKYFWENKLNDSAQVFIPEKRVHEMMKAGLLHIDLVCYGYEPEGPLAAVVGTYSPIGSESSPMIQYLDSMGRHDIARRAIMYFIEKQRENGLIQNFGGYMIETGAVLWTIGEHYRYTRDKDWIGSIKDNILKACQYIISWRDRNKKEEFVGKGYGMVDGKVADPDDLFHSFSLNSYSYIGLKRAAEVLEEVDAETSARISEEAASYKEDIYREVVKSNATCPVIPLGNGKWCPSISPWHEYNGPLCLYSDGGLWFTHGAVNTRDSLCGSMNLLQMELVEFNETIGNFILNSYAELFYIRNVAFTQPYYSPHPYVHLKRAEVKPFLKEFYNNFSSLADRETYTFWEHYHHVSPHKTHEEAWFLMRCRWMLYLEDGDSLKLLPGIPRRWLQDGQRISVKGMKTYFGELTMEINSMICCGRIKVFAKIDGEPSGLPKTIQVRVPHPDKKKAMLTSDEGYDPLSETITIRDFTGTSEMEILFNDEAARRSS